MNIVLPVQSRCARVQHAGLDSTHRCASTAPMTRPRVRGAALPVLVLVLGLALIPFGLIVVALKSFITVGGDSRVLRNTVLKASAAEWSPKIELNIGGGTLGLARLGLTFVDLPKEARAVLSAVRGAEVGVYQLTKGGLDRAGLLNSTDRSMSARGWERVVGVVNPSELVAVYLPSDLRSGRDVRLCVMVLDGEELVVVAARANLEPLLELARSQLEWPAPERLGTRL